MSAKTRVITEALKLTEQERLEIADALYDSLEGPHEPDAEEAWSEEIARRLRDVEAGHAQSVAWDEARRRITGGGADEPASR